MIKEAKFISVWDSGNTAITKNCKVNMKTKEVFDIEQEDDADTLEDLNVLDKEYIVVDGEEYDVFCEDEADTDDFWYR